MMFCGASRRKTSFFALFFLPFGQDLVASGITTFKWGVTFLFTHTFFLSTGCTMNTLLKDRCALHANCLRCRKETSMIEEEKTQKSEQDREQRQRQQDQKVLEQQQEQGRKRLQQEQKALEQELEKKRKERQKEQQEQEKQLKHNRL
jgi:hypothetical protein